MAKFERKINHCLFAMASRVETDTLQQEGIWQWLQRQARAFKDLGWLLAHADDGIIWGRIDQGQLVTSYEATQNDLGQQFKPAKLRLETLQQARLFATHAELLLWRDGDKDWQARVIQNISSDLSEAKDENRWEQHFDEPQLVWGTHGIHLSHDFTLLSDGTQGLRHAIPIKLKLESNGATRPVFLQVRHYLNRSGFAQVVASRLWGLGPSVG